jgi:hypothetical protein
MIMENVLMPMMTLKDEGDQDRSRAKRARLLLGSL